MTNEHRTYWEFNSDHARFGYMKRRIEALEREQSLLGKRVEELEARLRKENPEPIVGDITGLGDYMHRFYFGTPQSYQVHDEVRLYEGEMQYIEDYAIRMTPPEQEDDPR
jgi:hypothetical protein